MVIHIQVMNIRTHLSYKLFPVIINLTIAIVG